MSVRVSSSALTFILRSVLQSVAKAIQEHAQRDVTKYAGFFALPVASVQKSLRGVQYRNHDQKVVEGLKKLVDGFVEQFQVRVLTFASEH